MQIDSLSYLSSAIDAAFEAAALPALVLLSAALLIMAAIEIKAHVRRRRRPARRIQTAAPTARGVARHAET